MQNINNISDISSEFLTKGISEERFNEIFPHFDRVFAIEIEEMKKGDLGYELFYKVSNNTTISIGTIPKENILYTISHENCIIYFNTPLGV